MWPIELNDGTEAMLAGFRGHAVSLAALRDGLPVLGVVWAINAPDDAGGDTDTNAAIAGGATRRRLRQGSMAAAVARNGPLVQTSLRGDAHTAVPPRGSLAIGRSSTRRAAAPGRAPGVD
ncbi:MAG: hypothetical protein ABJA50_07480 [Chloroflexota bacterium]